MSKVSINAIRNMVRLLRAAESYSLR